MTDRTALYRHYDPYGRLLYIGVSLSSLRRTVQHKRASHWFEAVARIELEWFETRSAALAAEWAAIRNEKPKFNKAFNNKVVKREDLPILVIGDTFMTPSHLRSIAVH